MDEEVTVSYLRHAIVKILLNLKSKSFKRNRVINKEQTKGVSANI